MDGIKELMITLKANMVSINNTVKTVNNSVKGMMSNINKDVKAGLNNVKSSVNKGASSLISMFKKVGAAIGIAFSLNAIRKFASDCIDLASDLIEVQNVVDVTFGDGADKINNFAKSAAKAFGLSELEAKRYTGTLGAMLKSMGLTSEQVSDMSMQLTGLAGDFASFYNLDSKTAFEKIRSGIMCETVPLKQLGINMSAANLQAFALTQGITKQYSAMSEAEKVLLRYNYLMSVSKDAQGDFARNSNSWANQIRLLKLNFDSFKATLGQAFINILTPVIKVLNQLVGYLNTAATAFASFIASITGQTQKATNAVGSVAKAIGDVGVSTSEAVEESAKSAKKALGVIGGLDELVSLNKKDKSDEKAGVAGGLDISSLSTDVVEKTVDSTNKGFDKLNGIFDGVKDTIIDIGKAFKDHFINRLEGVSFDRIKDGLKGIKDSILNIGQGTSDSFKRMLVNWAGGIGDFTGSATKVSIGIGETLIGGLSDYLNNNQGKLTDTINNIFTNIGNYYSNAGNIVGKLGDLVYDFFTDSSTQEAVSNTISILSDLVLKPIELVTQFLSDASAEVDTYLNNMYPYIETTLSNISDLMSDISGNVKTVVSDVFTAIGETYDKHIRPALTNFREGAEKIGQTVLTAWNEHIYPVIKGWIEEFKRVYEEAIKPLIDQVAEFVGKLIENASIIYKEFVAPIVSWLFENLVSAFSVVFSTIGDIVGTVVELIAGAVEGIIQTIGGIIDFIVGVFTGDWEKAWEGLKDIVAGIWDTLISILKAPINLLIDGLNFLIGGLNKISFDIPDWVPIIGGKKFGFDIPKIPKLADGGIVTQATVALIGEAGAEGVIPLQNSQFIKDFAREVANAIGTNGIGNTPNINIGTLIQDDRGYEWLTDIIARIMARNGYLGSLSF